MLLNGCNLQKEDNFLGGLFKKDTCKEGEVCDEVVNDEDCIEDYDEYMSMIEKGLTAKRVNTSSLNIRTCNSSDCGILGSVKKNVLVYVYEQKGDWLRISNPYDAKCDVENKSPLVKIGKVGSNVCSSKNGIENGMVAKWIHGDYTKDVNIELHKDAKDDSQDEDLDDDHDDDHNDAHNDDSPINNTQDLPMN